MIKSLNLLEVLSMMKSIGLLCSMTSNSIIMYLLIFRSRTTLGTYRYLMISYTAIEMLYSLSYSYSDIAAHSTNVTYVFFRSVENLDRTVGQVMILQFCGMYTALITILSVHFVYRYVSLCATEHLDTFFSTCKLGLWVFSCLLSGVFIGIWKYCLLRDDEYTKDLLRPEFMIHYNLSMDNVVFNGPIYERCDNATSCYTPRSAVLAMSVIMIMLFTCMINMFLFGYKCYTNLQLPSNLSDRMKSLQTQLFNALLIQSIIPVIFMYIPISLLFLSPMFGIGFGVYGNVTMICLALYPPLDQFAILYVIRDFRTAVKDFIMGKSTSSLFKMGQKTNSVHNIH